MSSLTSKARPMTKKEALRLVELVEADGIITSKATNATNNKLKEDSWNRLTECFNSSVSDFPRCAQQLRLKWENLKKSARKRAANMRNSRYKDHFPPDEVLDKVASLLGITCKRLPANFGGDVLIENPDVPTSANIQKKVEKKKKKNRASGNEQAFQQNQELERERIQAKIKRDIAVAEYLTAKKKKIDAGMGVQELLVAKLQAELHNANLENERLKKMLNLPLEPNKKS